MTETWVPIAGWEGLYEVSDEGQVRSLDRVVMTQGRWGPTQERRRGRVLKPAEVSARGHRRVVLSDETRRESHLVHRLVAQAFLGPGEPGQMVLHGDDNPRDNRLSNLRWGTATDNAQDALRNGRNHNREKEACKRGHLLVEANLHDIPSAKGKRRCKACHFASLHFSNARRGQAVKEPTDPLAFQQEADRRYRLLVQ